jgi:tRNA A37 threonylcarbamoyltransferase TsaD
MLHLVLTFPGEPKNRNHYSKTVMLSEVSDVIMMLDSWSLKYVKNRNKDFSFSGFKQVLTLAKKLMSKQISDIEDIRQHVQNFD